jgi:hypothetical protein
VKASPQKTYQPPDLHHMAGQIMNWFDQLRTHERNRIIQGAVVGDPTTPSAQLTGTGNTTWSYNISAGVVIVDGVALKIEPAADEAIHSGSFLTGLVSGASCIAAIVAKNVSGTVSVVAVKGTPATTGSEVAPTDSEIQTAVGAGNEWVKLAECTLNRTGDTTVTETQDPGAQPILGVTVQPSFGDV